MITLADVNEARRRIAPYLHPTLLELSAGLDDTIWLKLENTSRTHSFKIRGALNAVLSLDEAAIARGIVTASSGNHAQGLAYAAHIAGVRAHILMPRHTPKRKVDGVRRYGGEAVLFGETYDQAEAEAHRLEHDENLTFVSAYADPAIIAGAGTIALEILEQQPKVERVIAPVSGGGLISGLAMTMKLSKPSVEVVGVTSISTPGLYNEFYDEDLPQNYDTLAEALSGAVEATSMTIPMTKQYVSSITLVTETQIAEAMRWLVDAQGWIVEGGGAVGVAAFLGDVLQADERPTVIVVSGGNIDGETLRRVLKKKI